MATTVFREDYLGRDLVTPTTASNTYMGLATTSTTDELGRSLRRTLRVNSTAYTTNTEIAYADGKKFIVSVAGTSSSGLPTAPAVGATVADGTATILRTK
jgi:hypothetical protein